MNRQDAGAFRSDLSWSEVGVADVIGFTVRNKAPWLSYDEFVDVVDCQDDKSLFYEGDFYIQTFHKGSLRRVFVEVKVEDYSTDATQNIAAERFSCATCRKKTNGGAWSTRAPWMCHYFYKDGNIFIFPSHLLRDYIDSKKDSLKKVELQKEGGHKNLVYLVNRAKFAAFCGDYFYHYRLKVP